MELYLKTVYAGKSGLLISVDDTLLPNEEKCFLKDMMALGYEPEKPLIWTENNELSQSHFIFLQINKCEENNLRRKYEGNDGYLMSSVENGTVTDPVFRCFYAFPG